jgi:hypothetical protein
MDNVYTRTLIIYFHWFLYYNFLCGERLSFTYPFMSWKRSVNPLFVSILRSHRIKTVSFTYLLTFQHTQASWIIPSAPCVTLYTQPIKLFAPKEIGSHNRRRTHPKECPRVGRILKETPRKDIVHQTTISNWIIRMGYLQVQSKVTHMIMIPKSSKPLEEVCSYQPFRWAKFSRYLCWRDYAPILEKNRILANHPQHKDCNLRQWYRNISQRRRASESRKETSSQRQ